MATLKDVAKDAGVSIATVSCCLSGSKNVKHETKMKVMDSIEKLKYIPNASARDLKSSTTNRIGIVLTDIDNLYHAEIFKGVSSYLQNENYTVSVAFSNNSPDIECEKIDEFISQNVSGLIIVTCQPQNTLFFKNRIKNYNIPTVFVERCPDEIFVSFASFNNKQTSNFITYELIKKGYRNIGLIAGSEHFSSERDCITGYKNAFINCGLTPPENLIGNTNMSKEDAFKYAMTSIDTNNLEAIITTSENIAEGVLEALAIKGLKVPTNIQLITFSQECWNRTSKLKGVIYTSRTAFTLGTSASRLLLKNIKSPLLFEEEVISYSDNIINSPLNVPFANSLKQVIPIINKSPSSLKILMVDLATSHSTKLLSSVFTRNTGIHIDFDFMPQNKMLKTIVDDIDSNKSIYDIYMYDVPWLEYMVQNSLVGDMSDFMNNYFNKDLLFKENIKNCKYEDKYYGVPLIGGSQIMFYRKDLFEKRELIKNFKSKYKISLRPPKTWVEFNGTSKFFTKKYNPYSPTEYGTSFAGIIDEELAPEILIRLWAYKGEIWDKNNRACLNSPENIKAFRSILQTLQYTNDIPFNVSIQQTVDDFSKGKTAMLITYTEYAAQISQSIHKNIIGRVGYDLLPGKTPISLGWNFGINPYTNKTDMAYSYFNWLCNHDTSYYMTILDGQSPVTAPYHSHELLKLYPWLEISEKSFDYSNKRNGPYRSKALVIPQNKIEAILCNVLRLILRHNFSIEDALNMGQEEMVSLFKYYGYPKPLHFI